MSQWDQLAAFSVAHELCGATTLSDRPDEVDPNIVQVTATCEGCHAQLTLPVNFSDEAEHLEPAEHTTMLMALTGKTLEQLEALTSDEWESLLRSAMEKSPLLRETLERTYQKAQRAAKRH